MILQRALALSVWAFLVLLGSLSATRAGPAMVIEPDSGLVIYAEDADRLWHPASLTKLMTAYLTFEALRDGKLALVDKIKCSEHALSQPPSKIGLPVGGEMTVDLALKALIIKSANDVAVMLAERIAGSEETFVERMNETAKRIGMNQTRFFNANGLPNDGQVTTARDMATLGRMLLKEFPQHADLYSMPSFKIGKRTLRSHNGLLKTFEGADGMKTGFICASGYNVVASAKRDGRRMLAVVLGAESGGARTAKAAQLIQHGFDFYAWKEMFPTRIDQMELDATVEKTPGDLKMVVCKPRPAPRRKRARLKAKTKAATQAAVKKAAPPAQ
jgi:D-alanyl-D-alanine carboxypeptidase